MILRFKLCDLALAKLTTVSFMHKLHDLNSSLKAQTSFTMAIKLNILFALVLISLSNPAARGQNSKEYLNQSEASGSN